MTDLLEMAVAAQGLIAAPARHEPLFTMSGQSALQLGPS
jgi:hypothetical protein